MAAQDAKRGLFQSEGHLDQLKELVVDRARSDLELHHAGVVRSFRDAVEADPDFDRLPGVQRVRGLERWYPLLNALFDLEQVRGKMITAYFQLQDTSDKDSESEGAGFAYHFDAWLVQADALVERWKTVTREFLIVFIPVKRKRLAKRMRDEWQQVKDELGKLRHPTVHGLGLGVDALTAYWAPVLSIPGPVRFDSLVSSVVGSGYEAIDIARRKMRFEAVQRSTLYLFTYIERSARQLLTESGRHLLSAEGGPPESTQGDQEY